MKASTKMTLFTLAAMCLLAASPAMAARQLLEETAGSFDQCGGTGDGCTGTKCADAQWATCSTAGFKCYRISQYYWQCADKQPPVQPAGAYSQCGGEGGSCKPGQCKDAEWPGATCPADFACQRTNVWWWQCNPVKSSPTPTPVPAKAPTPTPATPTPTKPTSVHHVHTYAQCGGEGGSCSGGNCKDAPWSDVACLSYDACTRINVWWWQCNPAAKTEGSPTPTPVPTKSPTPTPAKLATPTPTKPTKPATIRHVHTYAQCGGEGGSCSGGNCKDAAWSNVACLSYDACTRINNWWWQCNPKPKA